MKIIADEAIPFLRGVLEPYSEILYLPAGSIDRATVRDADALLIRTRTRIDSNLLEGSSVKFVGTATIGTDHMDYEWCGANGVLCVNAPGCNASSVQQYIAASLFTISLEKNFSLRGKTLGIIGAGNVGQKVEKLGRLLGMRVLLNDPPRERKEGKGNFVSVNDILRESDIITLHVPYTNEGADRTENLINGENLLWMKKGAWLINTSRGGVVEEKALKEALIRKNLAGSVMDVWEHEPVVDPDLIKSAFIATPHIAGYSQDGKANGTAIVVRKLAQFAGFPLVNWFPDGVPAPEQPIIYPDPVTNGIMQITGEAVLKTYPIRNDDIRFRDNPEMFEYQRNNYPVRREFPGYTIELSGMDEELVSILGGLGFRVQPGSGGKAHPLT